MKDENYGQWLKDLKVGDRVVIEEQYISSALSVSEVIKITPKGYHRVKRLESLLFKDGYYNSGGGYASYRMLEPTAERIDEINLIRIRAKLKSTNWSRIDDNMVREVWNLIRGEL